MGSISIQTTRVSNLPYKPIKRGEKKNYDHFIRCSNDFWQNLTSLQGKSHGKTSDTSGIPQYSRGDLLQAHIHHQPKWRKTESISTKEEDKVVHPL